MTNVSKTAGLFRSTTHTSSLSTGALLEPRCRLPPRPPPPPRRFPPRPRPPPDLPPLDCFRWEPEADDMMILMEKEGPKSIFFLCCNRDWLTTTASRKHNALSCAAAKDGSDCDCGPIETRNAHSVFLDFLVETEKRPP